MTDLDDRIAAASAAKKKKKKKKSKSSKSKSKSSSSRSSVNSDDSAPKLKSPPELLAANNNTNDAPRLKSPPEALVGAVVVSNDSVSDAERVKFGSGPGSSRKSKKSSRGSSSSSADAKMPPEAKMPGAYSASPSNVSNAERVKFGATSGAATMPGAQAALPSDVSSSERLKFGGSSSTAASMPGAHAEHSPSERLKFGDGSAAAAGATSMPGAQSSNSMSNAERGEFIRCYCNICILIFTHFINSTATTVSKLNLEWERHHHLQ